MNRKDLKRGQDILVLRYSTSVVDNCVEEHISIIKKLGYCWFGKVGNTPNDKMMSIILSYERPALLLYKKGKAYLCEMAGYTKNKPKEGYPSYYDEEHILARCYFKLVSIEEANLEILEQLIVKSSKRTLRDIYSGHCTSSFHFVSYKEIIDSEPANSFIIEKREKLDKNDCIYRIDGMCSLKTCINYQYECDRPAFCSKQKR